MKKNKFFVCSMINTFFLKLSYVENSSFNLSKTSFVNVLFYYPFFVAQYCGYDS